MNSITILPEDDPQAFKCAANLLARFTNRVLNPPRTPHHYERNVLISLQKDLKTKFSPNTIDLPDGEKLLKRLWLAFYGKDVAFSRYSKKWSKMGFQHNRDPTSDFRGGGLLSLQCLVYLFEKQPAIAKHMYELQSVRVGKRGEYANYPFACAGITLVNKLCEMLFICGPMGVSRVPDAFENSQLTFWQVISSRNSFYELFVWSFMVLDKLWDEMGATYMDFGVVMKVATQRISNVLLRLPSDVVPSARSFMIEEDVEEIMGNTHMDRFVCEDSMMIDDEETDNDSTHESQESQYSTLPSVSFSDSKANGDIDSKECLTGDLLGLESSLYDAQDITSQPFSKPFSEYTTLKDNTKTFTQPFISNQNFFEEFGLEL